MTMPTIEYGAITRGSGLLVHERFTGAPLTICGRRIMAVLDAVPSYRRPCPRCASYLARVS
jgi:hypothetical protein